MSYDPDGIQARPVELLEPTAPPPADQATPSFAAPLTRKIGETLVTLSLTDLGDWYARWSCPTCARLRRARISPLVAADFLDNKFDLRHPWCGNGLAFDDIFNV